MPPGLAAFLLDPGEDDDEYLSRTRCVVGLAFWGCFRPKEIAKIKGRDLMRAADGSGLFRTAWRSDEVAVPAIAVKHLTHYAGLRLARAGRHTDETALIVRLGSEQPLSAAAAWRVLKDWTDAQAEDGGGPLSTRAIRESHARLASAEAVDYLAAVESQMATRLKAARRTLPRQVGGQQVMLDLLRSVYALNELPSSHRK